MKRRSFLKTLGAIGIGTLLPFKMFSSLFAKKATIATGTVLRFDKIDSQNEIFPKNCTIDLPSNPIPVRFAYQEGLENIYGEVTDLVIDNKKGEIVVDIDFYDNIPDMSVLSELYPSITGQCRDKSFESFKDKGKYTQLKHLSIEYIDLTVYKNCDHGIKPLKQWDWS